jgi:hypothetical protein
MAPRLRNRGRSWKRDVRLYAGGLDGREDTRVDETGPGGGDARLSRVEWHSPAPRVAWHYRKSRLQAQTLMVVKRLKCLGGTEPLGDE